MEIKKYGKCEKYGNLEIQRINFSNKLVIY